MPIFKKISYLAILFLILFSFGERGALAAKLYFETQEKDAGISGDFLIAVKIDADKDVNAFTVKILVPDQFVPFGTSEANSIINFWLEKPHWDAANKVLTFSGITPGGFSGEGGHLLTVKFKVIKSGLANFRFEAADTKILLNTPDGLEDKIYFQNVEIPVLASKENLPIDTRDILPPEAFSPEINSDPQIFGGKYFLVFATQDKGSGMKRYEIREGERDKFLEASSPYLLKNQSLNKKIFVKAVDQSGNELVVSLNPRYPDKWFELQNMLVIIVAVLGFGFWFKKYGQTF